MTALREYQRLEASGLWRATSGGQRRDVIVSIGDATLVITDPRDKPLAHWSLPAVARANPGEFPAVYHPDGDPGETLELAESETDMIAAIEKLRTAIQRHRPHPGRLRLVMFALSMTTIVALAVFWLPGALRRHAVAVVPDVKRVEIGQALLTTMERVTGPACSTGPGDAALTRLANRLPAPSGAGRLLIVRDGVEETVSLPGGTILINRALVEDYEEPDVAAGYVIVERLRAETQDPLDQLLQDQGLGASFRLLTTGTLSEATLADYSETLLIRPPTTIDAETLLAGFRAWSVRSTPYAYARDISGETTLELIEADPFRGTRSNPVLSDADWLRMQNICGG